MITIETSDGSMPAYVADPDGPARGAVVVVQEAFGVTAHIEDVARRLAAEGWHTVAPAFFHREGSPVIDYEDLESVMPLIQQLTAEGITVDLGAVFDHLAAEGFGPSRTGIVGFCMGGSIALYAGTLRPLGAAVTFYGGGVGQGRFGLAPLVEQAPTLRAPWLGLFGDLDQGIPIEDVERLRAAAASAPVPTEVVRYPDADHGFHCDDRPKAFNAVAAADGWRRTLDWFGRHLSPS